MNDTVPVCRSCGKTGLTMILSLGQMPLANALLTARQLDQPEQLYPLDLVLCPHCALVQITETVQPEKLFREYLYFSSFSDTVLHHSQELVRRLISERCLDSNSLVVEVASNDGYLLQYYKRALIPVLGIEPAVNVARVAQEERGIDTLSEFFDVELARWLKDQGKDADVVHAHNVLAHVAELKGFVQGIQLLLKDDGVAVIEVPYVKDMMDRMEFDTIYHEHLCYFSLTSLDKLFKKHGLILADVERIPIHGGSLRLFLTHDGGRKQGKRVQDLLQKEALWGVDRIEFYLGFRERVEKIKMSLRSLLRFFKRSDKRIAAYGAAAKGTVLLNYCEIGREYLDFVVDRNPYKQGRYMPGVHLPIYSPKKLIEEMPDFVLLLTWNFVVEILEQQAEYRRRGGRFIIPIPKVEVL